ncbi:amino acid adenylation domain-containing protein [Streptosporangium sandarakinum]|uniref:amino acid adenylation domain-containing protein n=1 Tax=Streptosporangium sandarakinum TaxID=1260955 RepID=UPI0036ABC005
MLEAMREDPSSASLPGTRHVSSPAETPAEAPAGTPPATPVPVEWTSGPSHVSPRTTLCDLIAAQAARSPDSPAVRQWDALLTYRDLLSSATALAARLRALGVGPEVRVGLCLRRTPLMPVAALGVMLAGGAYVPLDPGHPRRRLQEVIEDAAIGVVVADEDGRGLLRECGRTLVVPEIVSSPAGLSPAGPLPSEPSPSEPILTGRPPADPSSGVPGSGVSVSGGVPVSGDARPGNAAYVLYTSGSTGRPKGVVVDHASAVAFVTAAVARFGLDASCRSIAFSALGFDVSVLDMFAPLTAGGCVRLVPDEDRVDPGRLQRFLEAHEVTWGFVPPALLPLVDPARLPFLRDLVTAGEPPGPEQVARWSAYTRFHNWYGPTETTVCVVGAELSGVWDRPLPIGRPLAGCRAHVLDDRMRECPVGVPGELHIGGPQVSRGYLGRPGLTAERFVPDPFSAEPGARLYRTGDRVAWQEDGRIAFMGRLDRQVKVQGQRVEIGEVESVVRAHPGVLQAVVDAPGELVAYVAPMDAPGLAALREHCASRLPPYMVPTRVVRVAALPLNASGKVDLGALRAAYDQVAAGSGTDGGLAAIWSRVLQAPPPEADDDFFAVGGHSLRAMRLVAAVRAELGREISVEDVHSARVYGALAARVAGAPRVGGSGRGGGLAEDGAPPENEDVRDGVPGASGAAARPVPSAGVAGAAVGPVLSAAQRRMWFVERLAPDTPAHNIAMAERVRGPLDAGALERALGAVVARHEALRWRVPAEDGVPRVSVAPAGPVPLPVEDLSGLAADAREAALARVLDREARERFDLAAGPLLRARLVRLAADEHVVAVTVHHIVFDGWSQDVFFRDLGVAYRGGALEPVGVSFGDYVRWARERDGGAPGAGLPADGAPGAGLPADGASGAGLPADGASGAGLPADGASGAEATGDGASGSGISGGGVSAGGASGEALEWWRAHLEGAPTVVDLPRDAPRPPVQTFRGAVRRSGLDGELGGRVRRLAAELGVTPYPVLLAAFGELVARLTGERDLLVGTPYADRGRAAFAELVGMCVRMLPLRLRQDGDASFAESVLRCRDELAEVVARGDVPLERVVEALRVPRDLGRNPVTQVLFNMYDFAGAKLDLPGCTAEPLAAGLPGSLFDLTLYVAAEPGPEPGPGPKAGSGAEPGPGSAGGYALQLVYNPDLFSAARMEALLAGYACLLEDLLARPDEPVRLARTAEDPAGGEPVGSGSPPAWDGPGLPESLRADAVAEGSGRVLDGAALASLRDRVAGAVRGAGVEPGQAVAVLASRVPELPGVLLGVLVSGARWVVLDPAYPVAVLARQAEAAGAVAVLRCPGTPGDADLPMPAGLREIVPPDGWEVAPADARGATPPGTRRIEAPDARETAPPDADAPGTGPCPARGYLSLTSGTTGEPKPVVTGEGPLAHFAHWYVETFGVSPADRFALLSGLAHDPALRDLFVPLVAGARLCVPEAATVRDPLRLAEWLRERRVTVLHLTPQLARMLCGTGGVLPDVRLVATGGDRLTFADAGRLRRLAPAARVVAFYGTTETPQAHAWYEVPPGAAESAEPVPAGRGVEGSELLVLAGHGGRAGVGELGEVVVRSANLADGYLDAELTRARFTAEGFRTGDLGRLNPDGTVTLAGRRDDQVKVRGFRVEPGGVEAALAAHPAVRSAAVVAVGGGAGGGREAVLYGYAVPVRPGVSSARLLEHLRGVLPEYAVPAGVEVVAALPLTPNGKVDRAALRLRAPGPAAMSAGRGHGLDGGPGGGPAGVPGLDPAAMSAGRGHGPAGGPGGGPARVPGRGAGGGPGGEPSGPTERAVAEVWRAVLGVPRVRATDNFFEIGGHSLAIAAVQARLAGVLGREVPVVDLFRHPTVRALAAHLDGGGDSPGLDRAARRLAVRRDRMRGRARRPD